MRQSSTAGPPGHAKRMQFVLWALLATIMVGGMSQTALAHESSSQRAIEITK